MILRINGSFSVCIHIKHHTSKQSYMVCFLCDALDKKNLIVIVYEMSLE